MRVTVASAAAQSSEITRNDTPLLAAMNPKPGDNLMVTSRRAGSKHRRVLAELDDHLLEDIGLTRADMEQELKKPLWRPSHYVIIHIGDQRAGCQPYLMPPLVGVVVRPARAVRRLSHSPKPCRGQ